MRSGGASFSKPLPRMLSIVRASTLSGIAIRLGAPVVPLERISMPGPASGGRNGPRPRTIETRHNSRPMCPSPSRLFPRSPGLLAASITSGVQSRSSAMSTANLRRRKIRRQRRGGLERVDVRNSPAGLDQSRGSSMPMAGRFLSGDRNGRLLRNSPLAGEVPVTESAMAAIFAHENGSALNSMAIRAGSRLRAFPTSCLTFIV